VKVERAKKQKTRGCAVVKDLEKTSDSRPIAGWEDTDHSDVATPVLWIGCQACAEGFYYARRKKEIGKKGEARTMRGNSTQKPAQLRPKEGKRLGKSC